MELKLPTLKYRRISGDMIEVYKLLMNKYDAKIAYSTPLIQEQKDTLRNLLRDVTIVRELTSYSILFVLRRPRSSGVPAIFKQSVDDYCLHCSHHRLHFAQLRVHVGVVRLRLEGGSLRAGFADGHRVDEAL